MTECFNNRYLNLFGRRQLPDVRKYARDRKADRRIQESRFGLSSIEICITIVSKRTTVQDIGQPPSKS